MVSCSCVLVVLTLANPEVHKKEQVLRDVEALERATLVYIESLGTDEEESARANVYTLRNVVASHGRLAIEPLTRQLEHKQVNVRRGAAITFIVTVEKHAIDDEGLLDKVLLRMVEDPDVKCRSNLCHVVRVILANMKKRQEPMDPSRPTNNRPQVDSSSQ